ncbi:MAG: MlaD family protein [Desulfohalobiaceae bacterium]|nr:MlaD family protein [Desulfohalobiaceae bacterium]
MISRVDYFKIGLFFLVGVFLVLGALFWIGAMEFYQETEEYVTYFDSSVEGLGLGSKVKYRGVEVGRVTEIGLAPDGELIRVRMELRPDFRIDQSRAAQLKLRGITGDCYLSLVKAPPRLEEITPSLGFEVKRPLIPSVPGQVEQVTQALRKVYHNVESFDLPGVGKEYQRLAANANSVLGGDSLNSTLREIRALAEELNTLAGDLNKAEPATRLSQAMRDISRAAQTVDKASASLQQRLDSLQPGALSDISRDTQDTLRGIQEATNSTRLEIRNSLFLLRRSLKEMDRALAEVRSMARTLKKDPGRVLAPARENDNFFGR